MTEPELQKQIDDLKADLKSLRTDLGELARILKDLGVGKVYEARNSVEEGLEA